MTMSPRLRKTVLLIHVATSVGWLGVLTAYLALDVTVATNTDIDTVRAAYTAMGLLIREALAPLAVGTVLIGLINALGTPWGLVRHYWVLVKLVLTVIAAAVSLLMVGVVTRLADLARTMADPRQLPDTLPHSIGGMVILSTTLILSVYKPRGLTRYGWRKQRAPRLSAAAHQNSLL
jgi:hypothetical protein